MKDVLKTQDPVKLSFAEDVLRQAGIESVVLDAATSSLYGGGLPFIKRRLSVSDDDASLAIRLLDEAFAETGQRRDD